MTNFDCLVMTVIILGGSIALTSMLLWAVRRWGNSWKTCVAFVVGLYGGTALIIYTVAHYFVYIGLIPHGLLRF